LTVLSQACTLIAVTSTLQGGLVVTNNKGDDGGPKEPPSIHEANLASGSSGAVEYGVEIDETTAIALRQNGMDVVVRGDNLPANRALAKKIEAGAGPPSKPQFPHTTSAGPMALPHFHQQSRNPRGHTFYETDKRKARKRP
jgi:hypothetical protein